MLIIKNNEYIYYIILDYVFIMSLCSCFNYWLLADDNIYGTPEIEVTIFIKTHF